MKILQICHKPPYPDTDGGTMASYSVLRSLHEAGEQVEVFALTTPKHPQKQVVDGVLTKIKIHYSFVDTRVKTTGVAKGLFAKHSYLISRFYSKTAAAQLQHILQNQSFDAVIFESLYTAVYLPLVRAESNAVCVYREHNIESSLWRQRAEKMNPAASAVIHLFNQKLTRFEFAEINKFDGIAYISKTDAQNLKKKGIDMPGIYVPFSYFEPEYEPQVKPQPHQIGFIGALNWEPNIKGLKWFLQEVWPVIRAKHPAAAFHVAGRGYNPKLEKWKAPGVHFIGEVASAPDFMRSCSILVVPLFESSGVRVKLVEASALGVPVITTPAGIKGLDMPENAMAVCENKSDFAREISRMLTGDAYRKSRGAKAREHILRTHKPEKAARVIQEFLKRLS